MPVLKAISWGNVWPSHCQGIFHQKLLKVQHPHWDKWMFNLYSLILMWFHQTAITPPCNEELTWPLMAAACWKQIGDETKHFKSFLFFFTIYLLFWKSFTLNRQKNTDHTRGVLSNITTFYLKQILKKRVMRKAKNKLNTAGT